MRSIIPLVFTLGAIAFAPTYGVAAPITLLFKGTGSGQVGATEFLDRDFTITAFADTNNVVLYPDHDETSSVLHSSASITIWDVGTIAFLSPTRTFVNRGSIAPGFARHDQLTNNLGPDLFYGPGDFAFADWYLSSSIGPVSGHGRLFQWGEEAGYPINTNAGMLRFNNGVRSPTTFQAIVVPEPGSIRGCLVVTLALIRRKRPASNLASPTRSASTFV
jgi:hypothetical protein